MVEDPIFKSGLGRRATQTHRLTNQHISTAYPRGRPRGYDKAVRGCKLISFRG